MTLVYAVVVEDVLVDLFSHDDEGLELACVEADKVPGADIEEAQLDPRQFFSLSSE